MYTFKICKRIKKTPYNNYKKNKTLKISKKYNKRSKCNKRSKYNNKRHYLKGGFISQDMINIKYELPLEQSIILALDPILKILPNFANDLIYISIGSKFNEPYFQYDREHSYITNTGYQMVPFFLCKNSKPRENILCNSTPCKVLNIVIDIFNDEHDIENSKRNITDSMFDRSSMDQGLDTSNITQFFINIKDIRDELNSYNMNAQISFLSNLIEIFAKKMRENNVDGKNFMVCNYIKFKQANAIESGFEKNVSNTILKVLTTNDYRDSCYDWCGYNPMFFYNCIIMTSKIKLSQQYNLLELKEFKEIDNFDTNIVFEITEQSFNIENVKSKKIIENLQYMFPIKNISDETITESYPHHRINNFVYSIYDFIKLNQ